jgi:hypothetical protein
MTEMQFADKSPKLQDPMTIIERKIESMKEDADFIKFNKDNISSISQGDLSNIVYQEIKGAKPFSTIQLPDRHLILP